MYEVFSTSLFMGWNGEALMCRFCFGLGVGAREDGMDKEGDRSEKGKRAKGSDDWVRT